MPNQNLNTTLDEKTLWKAVLAELQLVVSPTNYSTWLKPTLAQSLEKNKLIIVCQNPYTKDRLTKLMPLIQEAVNRIGRDEYEVKFVIGDTSPKKDGQVEMGPLFSQTPKASKESVARSGLFPKYTFDNYIMGKNNQLAFAIATAVAQTPGTVYNPVFFYSGVGLGKTHLTQAIGNKIMQDHPELKIIYCTGEDFTNEMIDAIRAKGSAKNMTAEFRDKYRKADVLLIDDIQFIAGKEGTQEEFFHTFNALYMKQKQIIITSDRPPRDFKNIEDRITSRFSSGIIADIQAPDYDTRMAILKNKRDQTKGNISDEVLEFIAQKVSTNIRELEGAYLQVLTKGNAKTGGVTLETAAETLGQTLKEEKQKPINVNQIIKAVCNYYSVKSVDLKGERRTKDIVLPRQVAMYLIKDLTGTPLITIGELLGGRDHTTIIHGVRKIEVEVGAVVKTRQDISNIKQLINTL